MLLNKIPINITLPISTESEQFSNKLLLICKKLRDIELNICVTTNENIHINAIVGIFKLNSLALAQLLAELNSLTLA